MMISWWTPFSLWVAVIFCINCPTTRKSAMPLTGTILRPCRPYTRHSTMNETPRGTKFMISFIKVDVMWWYLWLITYSSRIFSYKVGFEVYTVQDFTSWLHRLNGVFSLGRCYQHSLKFLFNDKFFIRKGHSIFGATNEVGGGIELQIYLEVDKHASKNPKDNDWAQSLLPWQTKLICIHAESRSTSSKGI